MKIITLDQMISGFEKAKDIDFTNALLQGCMAIEQDAKLKCPVDTGELRRSIKAEVLSKNSCAVGTDLEYGKYVEYGTGIWETHGEGRQDPWCYQDFDGQWHTTKGQEPQPYMEPAVLENIDKMKQYIVDRITEELL